MEDEGYEQEGQSKDLRSTLKSGSPDEVHDRVKESVQKGVAAMAGALRGFTEESRKRNVPEATRGTIEQAGETTRGTISTVTEQAQQLKEPLKEAGQKLSEAARDVSQTVRSEVERTKQAVKGEPSSRTGAGEGTEFPDIRSTPMAKSDKELEEEETDMGPGGP